MVDLDPRRLFSSSQRQELYELAEGRCQRCFELLGQGWHADHRVSWADGGPTEVENGQALCSACNILKGRDMNYRDTFVPRPFQASVIDRVLERISAGEDRTVVLASPGSGKTLAYQSLATRLIREGMIDYVAVFAPRTALAEQCETEWMVTDKDGNVLGGLCELFDATRRLGKIRHRVNEVPLVPPNERNSGFVATYSALVTNEETFTKWAGRHQGRFLLIADEGQFCGDDAEGGGTRAGDLIKKMHEFALHTLLLTGTPYRADNQKLILADYETHETDPKKQQLVRHAEATYADGIAEGYLRTFEMKLTDARISKRTMAAPESGRGDSLLEFNLSDDGSELMPALRDEKTWKPLVDLVVRSVRDKQKFNAAYRGLISCMQQAEAKKVVKYLRESHPDLRVGLAVSADSGAAGQALADFKVQPMDLLVTVRMAFIGYDCPQIAVVGVLTHYRDGGHLMQLIGRGLRVWKGGPPARQQSCIIVAPDDPKMQRFLDLMRDEALQGLRIIEERGEEEEPKEPGEPVQETFSYVESSVATTTRAASNEVDVEADEFLLIEGYKVMADSGEDATKLKKILEFAGMEVQKPVPSPREEPSAAPVAQAPKTDRAQIEELKSKASDAVRKELARRGVTPDKPGYQEAVTKAQYALKQACGFSADEANTLQKADKRLRAALNISQYLA
ncbi:DEAD/DEAH box helicase family protein [Actinacidiphila oryziradicis]|uniref:Endonuclease n=1 Tax=Actinacidiphila oryziradicis TaxID=2571141 RepID=A0A4V5MWE5_9ACTN|nr:DEAD/DEAH box helicase family protein [Actinacidiphila oryziradicis]TJZ95648.1 endonuclease [Actinacidiphila oryziradicis]